MASGRFKNAVSGLAHLRETGPADGAGESSRAASGRPDAEGQETKRPGPGRPRGKRSNPGYQQVTALLPSELYGKVRGRLFHDKSHGDFSDLLKTLLERWVNS